MNAQRVLLTGATGFVGKALLPRLQQEFPGMEIVAMSREQPGGKAGGNTSWVYGDLRDKQSLRDAMSAANAVLHTAAMVSAKNPADLQEVNAVAAGTLADVAREVGVDRFIFLSSSSVYGGPDLNGIRTEENEVKPDSPYGCSKLEGENRVRDALETHCELAILRPTGIYGPGRAIYRNLLDSMARWPIALTYRGDEIVHPCNIRDVVDGVIAVFGGPLSGTEIFNIAGERAIALESLKSMLCELANIRRRNIRLPEAIAKPISWIRFAFAGERVKALAMDKANGRFPSSEVSTKKIEGMFSLRWFSFEAGMAEMVASFD